MKKILITLFVVLGTAWWLFGQCTFDTLVNGGVNHQMTFSVGESYQGSCNFGCEPDKYHCWQMPSGVNAQINVCGNVAPPFTEIAVVITSECRWVHFSRCQVIGDPIMAPFTMQAYTGSDMQICAYWNSSETDSVGVFLKGYAIPTPVLSIIGDMDTCGTLLSTEAAGNTTQVTYKRLDDGKIYESPLPVGMYFLLDSETLFPTGRKIQVIE